MAAWTQKGFLIWHQRECTREQGPIRAHVSFTLVEELIVNVGAVTTECDTAVERLFSLS